MRPMGGAAIRPRGGASVSTSGPTFTAEDVAAFVQSHGMGGGKIRNFEQIKVQQVEFLMSQDVGGRFHRDMMASTGVPDNTLLCFVTLQGSFGVAGPSGKVVRGNVAYLVFDAQTGNILVRSLETPR